MDKCEFYTEKHFPMLGKSIGICQAMKGKVSCTCDGDRDECHMKISNYRDPYMKGYEDGWEAALQHVMNMLKGEE